MEKHKIFLYLAQRDKKGMKLLMTFPATEKYLAKRVPKVEDLRLPPDVLQKVMAEVQKYKMTHELWIESADDFQSLKGELKKRGHSKLPIHQTPSIAQFGPVDLSNLEKAKKPMLRRGSHQARLR